MSTAVRRTICNEYNCKIITHEWLGFGRTKKLAVDIAANDWILSIDADEEVSAELKENVLLILEAPQFNSYNIKRKSYYLGKMINYSGWHKDYPLRLFNRKFGNFNEKNVHESVVISGESGRLESPLFHYTYPTLASHIEKINKYSDLGAEAIIARNKSYSILSAIIFGVNKFIKMYLLNLGPI